MLYTIYRVTHRESGKVYIGKHQTLNADDGYMGSGQLIRRAVKKHGVEAFKKEVLHIFETEEEMNAKEAELVTEEFCNRKDTYNLCVGGQGGFGYIRSLPGYASQVSKGGSTTQSRRRQDSNLDDKLNRAASNTLKKLRETGWKPPISNSFLGKKHTDEAKAKIGKKNSLSGLGSKNSNFGKSWIFSDQEHTSKCVPKEEIASYLSNGWQLGRRMYKSGN